MNNTLNQIDSININKITSTIDNTLLLEILVSHRKYLETILSAPVFDMSKENIEYLDRKIDKLTVKILSLKHRILRDKEQNEGEQ